MRRYPTMYHLAMHFSIPVSIVHATIIRTIPLLHNSIVQRYIKWHSPEYWNRLRGTFPEWLNVVGTKCRFMAKF